MTYSTLLMAADRLEDMESMMGVMVDLLPGIVRSRLVMVMPPLREVLSDWQIKCLEATAPDVDEMESRAVARAERHLKSSAAHLGIDPANVTVHLDDPADKVHACCLDETPGLLVLGLSTGPADEPTRFVQKVAGNAPCDVLTLRI